MKRFSSIMNQLLQLFPRGEFEKEVRETKAERHARGFHSWDQFVSMLFCQLADAQSLREIVGGLASCKGRLQQLGISVPKRSTLAYANENRPWELYQNLFYRVQDRFRGELGTKTKFRFKNPLKSIDSTVVTLCAEMFPWATWSRQKGAVKLHLTLDHAGYLPEAMVITTGTYSELTIARGRRYARGTILVMDRGFVDYRWLHRLDSEGVIFVTRMKRDTSYKVVESREVVARKGLVADQMIRLTGRKSGKRYPDTLRLVTIDTEERTTGVSDQQYETGGINHRRHLQGPLANRASVPVDQAAPQDPEVPRLQRQCNPPAAVRRNDRLCAAAHRSAGLPHCHSDSQIHRACDAVSV